MSARTQVGKLLVGAAVLVPAFAVAALIVQSRRSHVHLDSTRIIHWLLVDAAVLLLGLMLNRGDGL